jgi:hypothetical protein
VEKVIGSLSVSIWVECPKCENSMELFDLDYVNDEGQLWKIIEGWRGKRGCEWENLGVEITCDNKECNHEFIFDELIY